MASPMLGLGIGSDNWRVTAYSRNVFDEEYVAEVIMAPEFGGAFVHPGPGTNERRLK